MLREMGHDVRASILGIRSPLIDEAALERLLRDAGYAPRWVSLAEASERIAAEPVPDLVLGHYDGSRDTVMERIFDLLRELRTRDRFVPLLALCPSGRTGVRVRALQLGADECMDREGEPSELLARVEALLRIKSIQDRMARSRRELQRRLATDEVTGVLGHVAFEARLAQEFERSRRYQEPLSLVVVDLDAFRELRQREGEGMSNAVLNQTAELLEDAVRGVDLVGRLSTDVFTLLLPCTHVTGAITCAERVWRGVQGHPFLHEGRRARLTCSIGIAFFPARGVRDPAELLRRGQEAVVRAKQEGRNRICLYQATHYLYEPPGAGDGRETDASHGRP